MTVPALIPTLKPFKEALAFHRSRVPISSADFARLSREAQLRAFTVSGLARQSSVVEAYRLAERAQETGMTMTEFRDALTTFLEANEGAALSPSRIDLIFRQAIGTARAVGRYEQMTRPEMLEARPYWMYPLGPDDDRTTAICLSLQGFIAPANAEVWQHIYPPNHFNERHLAVVSLTEKQAKESGRIYKGGNDDQYPFLEDRGGRAMPDPGFDAAPSLVASDGKQLLAEIANLGDPLEAKTAADYGLPDLADLPSSAIAEAPELLERLPVDPTDADIEQAWQRFQEATGIEADADSTILVDAEGDGVFVNRETFEHTLGLDTSDPAARHAGEARAQYFDFFQPTIEDPLEIWWNPRADADGQTVFTKVYIAMYRDPSTNSTTPMFVVRSPQGWLMWSGVPRDSKSLEALRRGYLSYRSYGRSHAA